MRPAADIAREVIIKYGKNAAQNNPEQVEILAYFICVGIQVARIELLKEIEANSKPESKIILETH